MSVESDSKRASDSALGQADGVSAVDDCALLILAGPSDVNFIEMTVRHILRMCAYDFREVIVVVDDLPKKGRSAEAVPNLLAPLTRMQHEKVISRIVQLSTIGQDRQRIPKSPLGVCHPSPGTVAEFRFWAGSRDWKRLNGLRRPFRQRYPSSPGPRP